MLPCFILLLASVSIYLIATTDPVSVEDCMDDEWFRNDRLDKPY